MGQKITNTYIIKGGKEGADRLRILAKATWPFTQPFLLAAGLTKGMHCLDAGCGNGDMTRQIAEIVGPHGLVTGIDFDPSVIAIAKRQPAENIEFSVHDLESESLAGTYDFIYCRFILSHLTSPENVLRKLKNALNDGGMLAIEDVDFDGHFCYPASGAFETYVRWYEETGRLKGADPLIGPRLLKITGDAGFHDIHMNVVLPTFYKGDGKKMAVLTLHAIREAVIQNDLATPHEFDSVLNDLELFTDNTSSIISLPRIFQLSALKS